MIIKISDIQDTYTIDHKEDAAAFYDAVNKSSSGGIVINTPVIVRAQIVKELNRFFFKGNLIGALELNCSRCLVDFKYPFDEDFSITLQKSDDSDLVNVHEIELTDDDLLIEQFAGDELDISKVVLEQIILLSPIQPLCNADCKGLCTVCGKNMNEKDCGCERNEGDNPSAVLKNIQ